MNSGVDVTEFQISWTEWKWTHYFNASERVLSLSLCIILKIIDNIINKMWQSSKKGDKSDIVYVLLLLFIEEHQNNIRTNILE